MNRLVTTWIKALERVRTPCIVYIKLSEALFAGRMMPLAFLGQSDYWAFVETYGTLSGWVLDSSMIF